MSNILNFLKKSEIYFIFFLIFLNLYCAFNTGDPTSTISPTNLTLAAVLLMMATDKLFYNNKN